MNNIDEMISTSIKKYFRTQFYPYFKSINEDIKEIDNEIEKINNEQNKICLVLNSDPTEIAKKFMLLK